MSSGESKEPIIFRHVSAFTHWLHAKFGANISLLFVFAGLFLVWYFMTQLGQNTNRVLWYIIATSPLWLPYILFYLFYESWMFYIQSLSRAKAGRVSLEILIPKEISKSPLAMENILTQLFQKASPDNLVDTYWAGKHPPYYSFEIISTGGKIRFIVNCQANKYKSFVENAFYSQYPGIEIRELPVDYTAEIPWDPENYGYMPIHFGKKNANPHPIKTYVDFGLDKDPKEEFKHDPLAVLMELLGSLKQGEHLWFQFMIKVHREETFQTGFLRTIPDWKNDIKAEIKKILDDAKKRGREDDEENSRGSIMLTPLEKNMLEALERQRTKFPFVVRIRVLYAAKLDVIDFDRVGQSITVFQQTEDFARNAIRYKWRADYDWNWWQDPSGKKRKHLKEEELAAYKVRGYEGRNHADGTTIMTTEEIATLFHLPSSVITTPNLARIPSTRGEAPTNLPTG
jgi:hypothetical protein